MMQHKMSLCHIYKTKKYDLKYYPCEISTELSIELRSILVIL